MLYFPFSEPTPTRTVLARYQAQPGGELAATLELVAVANQGQYGGGRGGSHPWQAHELLGSGVLFGTLFNVLVVLLNMLIQMTYFVEQISNDGVGPPRQILQVNHSLPSDGGGLERQHDAKFR